MSLGFKARIRKNDRGTAILEFAILLPILLVMLVGIFDVANLIYCYNKMNQVAQDISNIVTRGELTRPQLDALLQSSVLIAQPFKFDQSGNVIVTSISKQDAAQPPRIMWQESYPQTTAGSRIDPLNLPGGLVLNTGQTVIFTEVFFTCPLVSPGFIVKSDQANVYAIAASVPRQGQMTTLPEN